jgi:hypothetical protein
MIFRAMQLNRDNLRRGLGWMLRATAPACLMIFACGGPPSGAPNTGQDQSVQTPSDIANHTPSDSLKFVPAADSRAELQGTMTLGAWQSSSTDIHGQIVLDANEEALNALFDRIRGAAPNDPGSTQPAPLVLVVHGPPAVEISLPVKSLHGDNSGMDRDMQKALKASQHPDIEYGFQQLQQAAPQWDPRSRQGSLKLHVVGKLTMAGVERPITMDVIVTRDSRRHYFAHAQTTLLMSDFGVTPPVALFGLIRASNQVRVSFDLDLILTHDSLGVPPAGPDGRSSAP